LPSFVKQIDPEPQISPSFLGVPAVHFLAIDVPPVTVVHVSFPVQKSPSVQSGSP
jgi:hypothetical protein